MKRRHVAALGAALALGFVLLATAPAAAQSGQVSAQYQGYSAAGGQDPYANSNPQDVHVSGYGGQAVVTGYVKLNLESLPAGSNIDSLVLSLTPNGSQTDNVNPSLANLVACILTAPLSSNGYQATPIASDCSLPHAAGELQTNGDWHFEIASLAQYWQKGSNTGLALMATNPAVAGLPVDPSAWSIGFDHTKTTGKVDYSGGSSSSQFGPTAPSTSSSSNSSSSSSSSSFSQPASTSVLPSIPDTTAPSATPTATPTASPKPAAVPSGQTPTTPSSTASPRSSQTWIWLTVALGGAALLLVLVGGSQQLLRSGRLSFAAAGSALAASRSQLATPIATLALASVFALGFTSQAVGAGATGGSSAGISGASAGDQGGTAAAPGAPSIPGASGGPTSPGGPGSTAGGPGGAPGSTNGAPAVASNGNTNGGSNGPGVSATSVRIGFVHITNTQAANQAFGVNVPNPGDGQAEEQALVDYINKNGGLGGRTILPEYVAVDNAKAESDPNGGVTVCKEMVGLHVFAVVAGGGAPDGTDADVCYAQNGIINLDASDSGQSLAFLKQASPYIWMNQAVALDRGMRWEVSGLQSRGFFSSAPTYKLGVVVAQDPMNDDIFNQVTLPAIHAAGASSVDKFDVPHTTISDIANTMKQAVVHFQADGVTNVMFQGGANYGQGSYALLFMVDAESQHYNPRYGLSSDDAPIAQTTNVPQDQFQDAHGQPALVVGWEGGADTDDQHYLPWPSTPAEKQCASIEGKAGNNFSSRQAALAIIAFCGDMFELQQGAQGLSTLNAQLWGNHVMQLGATVDNGLMYKAFVGPDHWDAAGGYRLLHAVQNCETDSNGKPIACFEFDNGNVYGG